ncbi:unnamed protein product, partial [Durusdinium trenchii]
RAYRRVLRRPRGTRQDVSEGVLGAAVMMLRQGKISKQRRLLEVWIAMSPQDPKAAHHLLLLAMALWLRPSNGSRKRVEQLLGRAARVANPTLQPLLAELLGEVPPLHAPNELLALAAANRFLDAPQWQLLEDKCSLHGLLQASDPQRLRFYWPESYLWSIDHPIPPAAGGQRWWLKAALGHGGHSSRYVSDLSQLASPSESGRYLLQEDKAEIAFCWTSVVSPCASTWSLWQVMPSWLPRAWYTEPLAHPRSPTAPAPP